VAQKALVEEIVADVNYGKKKKKKVAEERERDELVTVIISLTRSYIGGEGWVALVHGGAEVEVAEESTEIERKREKIMVETKLREGRLIFC
jgi:tRNA G10  N-methylase Trm11